MLDRLAAWLHARGRVVLAVAIAGAVIAGAFGAGVTSRLSPFGANDPSTQSVQAQNRFQTATGRQIDPGVVAIVRSGSVGTAAARATVERVRAKLLRQPGIAEAFSYFQTHDTAMVARNGQSTYVVAYFRNISDKRASDDSKRIEAAFAGEKAVTLGGTGIANAQANSEVSADLGHAELLAFPFIFLLSLLFFRSLVAAVLPPLLGGLAIVFTLFALRIVSSFVDISVFAVNFVIGMGLGLAIDYSLFIVSRYREEAAQHGFGAEALRRTLQTAGRTVLFSSLTVTAAVASLIIFPQRFLRSMGIGGTICVLLAAFLALVVLPALLGVLGPRINALAPGRLARAAEREARPVENGLWFRLARFVMGHAPLVAVLSAGALIALGIPFTGVRFISVSAKVLPTTASARRVDTLLTNEFPPGRTAPLEVVVGVPAGSPQLRALSARLAGLPDVAAVAAPEAAGPRVAMIAVAPRSAPLSDAAQNLVHAVRRIRTPFYLGVTGQTALFIDLEYSLGEHLPIVLAVIVAATLLVLFLMTGSVVLPLKAVIMNALSLSAVFGILVLIFQDGHLQGLLSFHSLGALDATQPIFLMAVAFGLATDYGVFLLSRIKEARDAGASNEDAVAIGVERTGRIVTAAALLFAVAIGAFATSRLVFIKELGLGAALAVLIDASVVRALLVPSLMRMLGKWNWWAPAPLRRLHARIGLREADSPAAANPAGEPIAAGP